MVVVDEVVDSIVVVLGVVVVVDVVVVDGAVEVVVGSVAVPQAPTRTNAAKSRLTGTRVGRGPRLAEAVPWCAVAAR